MNSSLKKLLAVAAVSALVAGCANTATQSEIDEIRSLVDAAQQSADAANSKADAAVSKADRAAQTANDALRAAEDANTKLDRAFKQSMYK